VGTSATKRRAFTSTIDSDVMGVRLKTASSCPSSDSVLDAFPGKYSARFGGMPISCNGWSVLPS